MGGGIYEGFAEVYREHWEFYSELILPWFPVLLDHFGIVPKTVVDLACGTGLFATGIAKEGYRTIGIDVSPRMLDVARDRAAEAGARVTWLEQDMRDFDCGGTADLVTCWFDSLNYLTDAVDLRHTFARVRASLNPGGAFLFDMNTIRGLAERWNTDISIMVDTTDMFVVSETVYNETDNTNTLTVHAFIRRGDNYERVEEEHTQRGYPLADLRAWLTQAGFGEITFFTRRKFSAADETSYRAFVFARAV